MSNKKLEGRGACPANAGAQRKRHGWLSQSRFWLKKEGSFIEYTLIMRWQITKKTGAVVKVPYRKSDSRRESGQLHREASCQTNHTRCSLSHLVKRILPPARTARF